MAKGAAIEVLIPDVHNEWDIYDCLDRVLEDAEKKKKPVKRVFHLGDLRQDELPSKKKKPAIYYNRLPEFDRNIDLRSIERAQILESILQKRMREYGAQEFIDDLTADRLSSGDKKLVKAHGEALAKIEATDDAFRKESLLDYGEHQKRIKRVAKKYAGVEHYGVPGNHDTAFIYEQVDAVNWLTKEQKLAAEGVIGALVCREKFGEMNDQFNGPGLRYAPAIDDDYDDLSKSKIYQENKGKPLDLIVSHCGGHWGKARRFKGGLGITKLGEENPGMVNYAGHDHDMIVYRDPKTKVLTIRPGTNYVAKVYREGKDVKLIEFYRIRRPSLESLAA